MLNVKSDLAALSKGYIDIDRQLTYATSVALNKTAEAVKSEINHDIVRYFDRPTPYTRRALRVVRATRDTLQARVDFKDGMAAGKGTPADKYLWPQVHGGGRGQKRSERALDRIGALSGGQYVPGAGATMDAYGNMSRSQIVTILSYLQAFSEVGYKANMKERGKRRLAKMTRSDGGAKKIGGVQYFVSRGKGTMSGNREQNLPAGVWAKTGIHGSEVKPVMVAINDAQYTPILPFYETAEQVFNQKFDAEYTTAVDHAIATARVNRAR